MFLNLSLIKRYLRGGGFLGAMNIVVILARIISLPIVVRFLSKSDYGSFRFVITLQMYVTLISGNYIVGAAKRSVARGMPATIIYAFLARIPLLGLAAAAIMVTGHIFSVPIALSVVMAVYLIIGFSIEQSVLEYLVGLDRMGQVAMLKGGMSVFSTVFAVWVVVRTQDVFVYSAVYFGTSSLIAWVVGMVLIKRHHLVREFRRGRYEKSCLRFGLKMIPVDLMIQTLRNASVLFVGGYFGMADLAVFSSAKQVKSMAAGFIRIVRPLLYADIASRNSDDVRILLRKRFGSIMLVSFVFGLVLGGLGIAYLRVFMPRNYSASVGYFVILAAAFPAGLATRVLITFLDANLMFRELALGAFVPNAFRLIFVIVLGLWIGIPGICIGSAIGSWLNLAWFAYLVFGRKKRLP